MKRLILIFFVFLYFIQLNSIIEESASLTNFFFGTEPNCAYSNWESHIVEGVASEGYNMYAPYDRQTEGFGQFTLPTEAQTDAWEEAIDYFFAGQYNDAHNVFVQNNIPYSVVKLTDGNVIYYMLRENLNSSYSDDNGTAPTYDDESGSFDFGWGIFVYRTANPNPILVTAPHPNDDFVSPYLAVKSFINYESQYLMINGSGREVLWSGNGNYSNNKSYSDPTRNHDHPFNYVYKKACDKIREDYDRRELSIQLHSYDWDSHPDRESCQISPGQYRRPAGLPIRDFSNLHQDVIQNTDYIVIPEGTIGTNEEVTVRDYYSVHNSFYDTVYQDTLIISNNVDLPGYSNSFHDNYTTENFSDWDVFSPFFHVEFDELPNCYPQNEEEFKQFYGYSLYTNSWTFSQKYTKLYQYYQPFIDALDSAVEAWVEFDDGEVPQAPSNIRRFYGGSGNSITWDSEPCYDFYSYEVLYSVNPISSGNYTTLDRSTNPSLAFPAQAYTSISNLELNQTYFIAMRITDYNGNVSPISEEFVYTTLPISTTQFDIYANDSEIEVEWTMNQQQNCLGFEIYRSDDGAEFELYSSYLDNSGIEITTTSSHSFSFIDDFAELGHAYSYRVNVVNTQGYSNQLSQIMNASLANYIELTATGQSWNKSVTFGKSMFATTGYDVTYDELNEDTTNYLALNNINQEFTRNIIAEFDPTRDVRTFDITINNPPTNLSFSLDTGRFSERFYLLYNNELFSFDSQPIELNFPEEGYYTGTIIWGNLQAKITFPELNASILYEGEVIDLAWNIEHPELVESIDLCFKSEQDSLFITENLSPEQTTYSFTNNITNDYRMLNFVVQVNSTDGEAIQYYSDSRVVLVSEVAPLNLWAENSNQLFAYPFTSDYATNQLPASVEAFAFADNQFSNTDSFTSNQGYFLNINEDFQFAYNGIPVLQDSPYPLFNGWNLINNPHPIDYAIQDILFEKNDIVRSFKNTQESGYILPQVIGIREGCYTAIDTLKAFESAFLFKTNDDQLSIRFDPVNQSEEFNLVQPDLFFTVEFKTASGAKDELTVGLQAGLTPVLDDYFDFMKAPLRPTNGLQEAYIVSEEPLSNYYPKMHTKLQSPAATDTYSWEIAFTNTSSEPVQARIKNSNNSDNYPLDLNFNGTITRLSDNYLTIANTDNSGTYNANLTIMTVTPNSENDIEPISQLLISPNPVSKQAKFKISNTRNKDFTVSVYNLKGQKVQEFNNKDDKADNGLIYWDLTNKRGNKVSSGIYFVKFKEANQAITKKICIIK